MKTKKKIWIILLTAVGAIILLAALTIGGLWIYSQTAEYGFARNVSDAEATLRMTVVETAESWLGTLEGSETHEQLIGIYNAHEPLAQGYEMTVDDNWCAAFSSTVAIQCSLTDIVPTECGCERQIGLWMELGRWEEMDSYVPLPGDYIYYAWDDKTFGDCTGWADHVGIVVGTAGPFIKIIEGNKDDQVTYRIILINNYQIRGYGLPDYASKST